MDWKKLLSPVLFNSALVFSLFISDVWDGQLHQYGTHQFAFAVFLVIGGSIGIVGIEELKSGGHRKSKRYLLICTTILFIIFLIHVFISTRLRRNTLGMNSVDSCLLIAFYVLMAASFPIALYLNRNQNKSTSQPTADDAS
ncbi:MAG: hypothetical protein ABSG00_08830 [Terracidiphilus sp.]|jgi:Na+-driven multidrug efflux pump